MGWNDANGIDWLTLGPGPADSATMVAAMVDFGLADQPATRPNLLAVTAELLHRELARPIELPAGGVADATVSLHVEPTAFSVAVSGPRDAVPAAWARIGQILRGELRLSRGDTADILADGPDLGGWSTDLALRFGAGPLAFSTLKGQSADAVTDEEIATLIDRLDPRRALHRWVCWTTDPRLVGSELSTPDRPPGRQPVTIAAQPGSLDQPSPHQPGWLAAPYAEQLFSGVVPATPAGSLVARVVAQALGLAAAQRWPRSAGARLESYRVDRQHYLIALLERSPASLEERRRLTDELLEDLARLDDAVLQEALDRLVHELSEHGAPVLDVLATVFSDPAFHRRPVVEVRPDWKPTDDLASVDLGLLRTSLDDFLATAHRAVPPGGEAPTEVPPLVPPLERPRGRRFASWATAPAHGLGTRLELVHTATVLWRHDVSLLRGALGHSTRRWVDQGAVDLRTARLVVRTGDDQSTIFDDRLRSVTVPWTELRRPTALRRLLEPQLASVPVLDHPPQPALGERLRREARGGLARNLALPIVAAVLIGLLALVSGGVIGADRPRVATVAMGQPVELSNGSTLTASDPTTEQRPSVGWVVTVQVRFCAGRDTRSPGTSGAARRYIGPEKFTLTTDGRTTASRVSVGSNPAAALPAVTLDRGQCTDGLLAYGVPTRPERVSLRYSNLLGDEVTWQN